MNIEEKKCLGCKKFLPLKNFAYRNKEKGTLLPRCRKCHSIKYYTPEQKIKQVQRSRERRSKLSLEEQYKIKDKYKKETNCIICLTTFKYSPSQQTGNFCSTKCQQEMYYNQYIFDWKAGRENGLCNTKHTSNSGYIKTYMKKEFPQCLICNLSEWMNKPIPLEMDHIDGDATNNRPKNLRMLCRNCHGQTDTFGAKNKNSKRVHYYKTLLTE